MISLKPCPFCGSNEISIRSGMIDGDKPVSAYFCKSCGGAGPFAVLIEHALSGWQRRVEVKPE